jgi:hypothetical protein
VRQAAEGGACYGGTEVGRGPALLGLAKIEFEQFVPQVAVNEVLDDVGAYW